jgi:type IV pilus assembly protein PilA
MRNVKGFTLIELMIVVAIIGILAAIAIPAYQDYTRRAHVSEGLSVAAGAKTSVTEYYSSNGKWPTDNTAAGLAAPADIKGNAVKSVEVNQSKLTITYNVKTGVDGSTVILQGKDVAGSITWDCKGGTVVAKYRPANCR